MGIIQEEKQEDICFLSHLQTFPHCRIYMTCICILVCINGRITDRQFVSVAILPWAVKGNGDKIVSNLPTSTAIFSGVADQTRPNQLNWHMRKMSQPTLSLWASRAARKQSLTGTLHTQQCQYRLLHTSHFGTPIVANPRSQQHALPTSRQSTTNTSRSRKTLMPNPWRNRQRLAFTTTAQKKATAVLTNPRNDDDGNPMLIEISERAAKVRSFWNI